MTTSKLEFSRGDIIASKYEVLDLLDENPLGLVYRVKHLKSGKFVRLTLLRARVAGPEQQEDVINAFTRAKEVPHSNLIKVGELGEHDGVTYYTMEDFEGSTLRELLQEYKIAGKQFAVKEAAHVVIQICEALQAAHDAGLVLRALRPEYVLILVRRTGPRRQNFVAQVRVVGAGFWSLVPAGVLAEDEFTRGEAQYLAPELKSFEPEPTPRCDVYSCGVILYEMLTGSAPVGTFQLPGHVRPDLPPHVNDVVELALANAPEDRYQTANDLINDIQRIFQEAEIVDEAVKRPLMSAAGWAVGLLVVLAVAVIMWQLRPDPLKDAQTRDATLRSAVYDKHVKKDDPQVQAVLAQLPENMVFVPGGTYISGRLHAEFDARSTEPLAVETEVGPFLVDVFEYPNLLNAEPLHDVDYTEAERLCAEAGKRLCTETEWEKACKGTMNYIYSYGDTFDPEYCGEGLEQVYTSGAMSQCKSSWGAYDLSGNFREWTASQPKGKDVRRIVKGGMRQNPTKGTRCAFTTDESIAFKNATMGFRCCLDVDELPFEPPAPPADEGEPTPE